MTILQLTVSFSQTLQAWHKIKLRGGERAYKAVKCISFHLLFPLQSLECGTDGVKAGLRSVVFWH